ncbi:MAG: SUMF1/EgtB/PvdO family nonheme iron enzyme [Pirellulales bacterium]
MKRINVWIGVVVVVTQFASVSSVGADVFGSGANSFEIEFVTIGEPGNAPDMTGDPNPAGSVPYVYRIGKYEISEAMIDKANAQSVADGGLLGITHDMRGPNKPATSVSWFEAAKFVNWLNASMGDTPAYKFDANGDFQLWLPSDAGYDTSNPFRNGLARYVLPSDDEWYKAAFYDPVSSAYHDYPTGSDIAPISVASGTTPGTAVWNQPFEQGPAEVTLAGGVSPSGTVGQGGNVLEWEETETDLINDTSTALRGVRGGDWISSITPLDLSSAFRNLALPERIPLNVGFRVASVPEPTMWCLVLVGISLLILHRRRKHGFQPCLPEARSKEMLCGTTVLNETSISTI